MADKTKKRIDKSKKASKPRGIGKIFALFGKAAKGLKNFFINLKAELKRVIFPDKKSLIRSTATVLAICLMFAVIFFIIDNAAGGLLNAIGFYSDGNTSQTTVSTTVATTASETSATTSSESASSEASETTAAAEG